MVRINNNILRKHFFIAFCVLGKMVTFETPLMFSRSSSIASLGSCEPQEGYIGSSAVSECRYKWS